MDRDHRGGWKVDESEYSIEELDNRIILTLYQDIAFKKIIEIDTISGQCKEEIIPIRK